MDARHNSRKGNTSSPQPSPPSDGERENLRWADCDEHLVENRRLYGSINRNRVVCAQQMQDNDRIGLSRYHNDRAHEFWRTVGFTDFAITFEMNQP